MPTVAPRAGAWIETLVILAIIIAVSLSHPVRVRGLKQLIFILLLIANWSHPVRVRGLKLCTAVFKIEVGIVAPRAGAWIETTNVEYTLEV